MADALEAPRLRPEWRAPRRAVRIFRESGISQCRHKEFVALAFEFLLGGFEVCDAVCDFFPLLSGFVLWFGHAHAFLILAPPPFAAAIEARIGSKRRSIVIALTCSNSRWIKFVAVEKTSTVLVACGCSR